MASTSNENNAFRRLPDNLRLSSQQMNEFHKYSDVDSGETAQHHTLGIGPNNAASGNHGHSNLALVNHVHSTLAAPVTLPTPVTIGVGNPFRVCAGESFLNGAAVANGTSTPINFSGAWAAIDSDYGATPFGASFTAPAKGWYSMQASAALNASSGWAAQCGVLLNGAESVASSQWAVMGSMFGEISCSGLKRLNLGDVLTWYVYQASGVTQGLQLRAKIARLPF